MTCAPFSISNCAPVERLIVPVGSHKITAPPGVLRSMLCDMVCGLVNPRASTVQPVLGQAAMAAFTLTLQSAPGLKLASTIVDPLPMPKAFPLPPETKGVRTSVTEEIAALVVTTVAIGMLEAVKPVVFDAGAQLLAGSRYT